MSLLFGILQWDSSINSRLKEIILKISSALSANSQLTSCFCVFLFLVFPAGTVEVCLCVCVVRDPHARVYVCQICGRRYSTAWNLSAHMAVHQGRTMCTICGAIISSVRNLRRHMETLHNLPRPPLP